MLIDMHTHTAEGSICSSISVDDMINKLKVLKYDGVLITDHFCEEGYHKCRSMENFTILLGCEITTTLGDMLVILPSNATILEDKKIQNEEITPIELTNIVHKKEGVIGIAHMFRRGSIGRKLKTQKELEELISLVDFIEVENASILDNDNNEALYWANVYKKTMTKGSDSHSLDQVGAKGTLFTVNIKTQEDLISAIKNNYIIN